VFTDDKVDNAKHNDVYEEYTYQALENACEEVVPVSRKDGTAVQFKVNVKRGFCPDKPCEKEGQFRNPDLTATPACECIDGEPFEGKLVDIATVKEHHFVFALKEKFTLREFAVDGKYSLYISDKAQFNCLSIIGKPFDN